MTNFNAEINLRPSGIVAFATRWLGDSDTRIGQQSDQHDESTQIGPSGGDIGHRSKPTRGARRRWGGPLAVAFSLAAALPHAAGAANAGRAVGEGASHAAADASAVSDSVWLEDLTSTELKDRIRAGTTTLLVPIGGIEQSGPGIALGKHNQRVRVLVQRIAEALGNAVVAPVVAYVPEGNLAPPTSHMRFTGTISVPDDVFVKTLIAAAESLQIHGIKDVVFLGDHGGYQKLLEQATVQLNRRWAGKAHAFAPPAYYRASSEGFATWLRGKGYSNDEIGQHAGLADASLQLAVAPQSVRLQRLQDGAPPGLADGVQGNARRASAQLGQAGVEVVVRETVAAIRQAVASGR